MAKSKSTDAILAEAEQIARVWAANPTFSLGDLTLAQFQAMITDLRTKRDQTQQLRTQLTALINDTNAGGDAVANVITLRTRLHPVRTSRRHTRQRTQTHHPQTQTRRHQVTHTYHDAHTDTRRNRSE
jgi:hypothetical protein